MGEEALLLEDDGAVKPDSGSARRRAANSSREDILMFGLLLSLELLLIDWSMLLFFRVVFVRQLSMHVA